MSESFTAKQVAEHKDADKGLYIIIDGGVYALESFVDEHPGGAKILKRYHNEGVLKKYGPKLKVGDLKEEAKL
ncbi:hypothetical protein SLS60_009924 [Paraconiothyrium brasiliense]|uniref:Cytochrome b5 heme-binding domain-containing protein n=1 Tax=Paraconiothyrium brasiliense TaxID=300254 RepID=A0ABR3QSU7_9PLEO